MSWWSNLNFKKETEEVDAELGVDSDAVEGNPVDKAIVEHGDVPAVSEIYKARWVWYHTILAIEIFCTNILLIAILLVLALK